MALSAMGSAGAWFAGYLKKDERHIGVSQRDRLLDISPLPALRLMEELDQMRWKQMPFCATRCNATSTARSRKAP
jgi:hypothetical protein